MGFVSAARRLTAAFETSGQPVANVPAMIPAFISDSETPRAGKVKVTWVNRKVQESGPSEADQIVSLTQDVATR